MKNAFTELAYTSVSNLLLLPPEFNLTEHSLTADKVISQNAVFSQLAELEFKIKPILRCLEQDGLLISSTWFSMGLDYKRHELDQLIAELNQYTAKAGSTGYSQMKEYWKQRNLLPADTKQDLIDLQHLHPTYALMLNIKKTELFIKQWGHGLASVADKSGKDFRITGKWQSYSSYTGRITARRLALTSIPNRLKSYVIPPEGYQIVSLDIHSAELRFLAYLARCEPMLTKFNSGQDVYMEIAVIIQAVVFQNEPVDASIARDLSKKYTFSMLYGASENTIRNNVRSVYPGITTADISRVNREFDRRYPEIIQFLRNREQSEELLTVYGKVRPLALLSKTQKRNYTLQSSVAVAAKLLMIEAHKYLRVLHVIHDEIWLLTPIPNGKTLDEIIKVVTSQFYETIDDLLPDFPTTNLLSSQKIGGKINE